MLDDILGAVILGVTEHIRDDSVGLVEGREVESLFCTLHRLKQFGIRYMVVADEGDAVDFDFFPFVDMEKKVDGAADFVIGPFFNGHLAVVKAFVYIEILDQVDAGGLKVVVDNIAL